MPLKDNQRLSYEKGSLFIFLIIILMSLSGCANNADSSLNNQVLLLQEQVNQYIRENEALKEIADLKAKLAEYEAILNDKPVRMERAGDLLYLSVSDKEKIRLVRNKIDLKALSFDDAPGAKYTESADLPDPNGESQWKI